MSLRMAVLGSGSGGNSTLLELDDEGCPTRILIDAGFSPRETARRLAMLGLSLTDIHAVLVTHLDGDHLRDGWRRACPKFRIPLHLHRRHYRRADLHRHLGNLACAYDAEFSINGSTRIQPLMLAHDDLGTVGFVIEHRGARLGFATDLGRVPESLLERFIDLDLLAIESNYDRRMQIESGRPPYLKRRIMGGSGHLSNEQSLSAVLRIASRSRLRRVVLLHISRQCNDPKIIQRLYEDRAPSLASRLTIATQFETTGMLDLNGDPAMVSPAVSPEPSLFTMSA